MRNPNFARANVRAKFWTPLAQNPGSTPASIAVNVGADTCTLTLGKVKLSKMKTRGLYPY